MNNTAFSLISLNDLALIGLTGSDATSFLQSQLTQDVATIGPDRAVLAGYCTARGRLLASMIAVQQEADPMAGWWLLTKADCALAFAQRLRMFVLRAKVDITIEENAPLGLRTAESSTHQGDSAIPFSDGVSLTLPDKAAPYTVVRQNEMVLIRTPDPINATQTRWWMLNGPLTNGASTPEALQIWQADDIAAGLPWVQAATQETFIPQTLNMDLIGGVSFTKGCYPGQEVVARSHYRGTIKRRMAYACGPAIQGSAAEELAGADTYDANNPGRPCGRVINAAVSDDQLHVLMEVQLNDLNHADFRIGSADGVALTVATLPYDILDEAKV